MVIYADVLFTVNFISSYMQLYIIGRLINKLKVSKLRLTLAAIIGGASACVVFCTDLSVILSSLIRLGTMLLMVFTAFYELKRSFWYQIGLFILVTGIMVFSTIILVSLSGLTTGIVLKGGFLYFNIPSEIFVVAFALSYLLTVLFIKLIKKVQHKKYYNVVVCHNNSSVCVTALFDSGNLLKEPITGKPVSIFEWDKIKSLFDADYGFYEIEQHAESMKLWVVPYKTIGNPSGMLFAFIADNINIPEKNKIISKTFIAVYNGDLSSGKEYHALLNASLL